MLDTVKNQYALFSKFNFHDTYGDSHSSTQQNSGTPVGENGYLRLIFAISYDFINHIRVNIALVTM